MMGKNLLDVSVVLPCLNEVDTVGICINKAMESFLRHSLTGEVIVADNGSSDGSQNIATSMGARIVHVEPKGYGSALMGGIAQAKGRYIIMGDADDSYDFTQIYPFIRKLREGYQVVVGCRLPSGGGKIMPGAMPWKNRWIGNPVLSGIGRLFFRSPIHDFHCGLRGFRKDAFEAMNLHTTGMEFASEMIIKANLMKLKIAEIPITLYKDGRSKPSNLRPWRDGWRHLRFMLLYSPRWLFLIPGFLLFIIGLLIGGRLLYGPILVGQIGFDTNTLLLCAMGMLVGFQLIAFATFTKIFAISEGFLPEDRRINKMFRIVTLEKGILAGLFFCIGGVGLLFWGILFWHKHNFGPMSYPDSLRIIVPGITFLTLGVEIIFSSFFMSILGLSRK